MSQEASTPNDFEAALRAGDANGLARAIASGALIEAPMYRNPAPRHEHDVAMLTPLGLAAHLGQADCVRVLLACGANPNAFCSVMKDIDLPGPPPLWWAVGAHAEFPSDGFNREKHIANQKLLEPGKITCMELLLEAGADIEGGFFGQKVSTPLMHACSWSIKLIASLASKGARVDAVSACGRTALICASFEMGHSNPEIYRQNLSLLIELGAGRLINAQDELKRSALWYAARDEHPGPAQFLIQAGAAIDNPDDEGRTELHQACLARQTETVCALLEAGANPNTQDLKGLSPLMLASEKKDIQTMQALIDAKADLFARDENGLNCLDYANDLSNKAYNLDIHAIARDMLSSAMEREQLKNLIDEANPSKSRRIL